jgi:hypothetical protein
VQRCSGKQRYSSFLLDSPITCSPETRHGQVAVRQFSGVWGARNGEQRTRKRERPLGAPMTRRTPCSSTILQARSMFLPNSVSRLRGERARQRLDRARRASPEDAARSEAGGTVAGDEFGFTHMDRWSSEARPPDLISAQTASATARDTPVAGSIARRQAGAGYLAGGGGRAQRVRRFDALAPRRGSGWLRGRLQGTRRPFLFSFLLCSNSIQISQEWQNKIKIKSSTTDSSLS